MLEKIQFDGDFGDFWPLKAKNGPFLQNFYKITVLNDIF